MRKPGWWMVSTTVPNVGSSSSSTTGSCTRSTPMDTLLRSPPDTLATLECVTCRSPSSAMSSLARASAASGAARSHRRALYSSDSSTVSGDRSPERWQRAGPGGQRASGEVAGANPPGTQPSARAAGQRRAAAAAFGAWPRRRRPAATPRR